MERPKVLVVAGYDPSGGAGVLADVKTLEANGVYAYAVCTAMTIQHEWDFRRVDWLDEKVVFEQIDICFASAGFEWVKMGITASTVAAGRIIQHLQQHNPGVKVVWDPVIKASTGGVFWKEGVGEWEEVAAECFLLTPNWEEIGLLYPGGQVEERCGELTARYGCRVYLKGGHHPRHPGRDYLWSDGQVRVLDPGDVTEVYPKHGSGCVLASALTANLALGYPLGEAAMRAKEYTARFLRSNKTLLGWHDCIF